MPATSSVGALLVAQRVSIYDALAFCAASQPVTTTLTFTLNIIETSVTVSYLIYWIKLTV